MRAILTALVVLALTGGAALAAPPPTVCDFLVAHPVIKDRKGGFVFPPGTVNVREEARHDLDLDGDGKADEIATGLGGTSHSDSYEIKLSSLHGKDPSLSGKHDPAQPEPEVFSALGYDQGSVGTGEIWINFDSRYYEVNYSDNSDYSEVEHVEYYLPNGMTRYACIFKNEKKALDWKYPSVPSGLEKDAKAVCPLRGEPFISPDIITPVARISKKDAEYIPKESLRETHFGPLCEFEGADCKDIWRVDFDNDGVPERLVKLAAYSGAGRGCDMEKFVILDGHDRPMGGTKQATLETLRGGCESHLDWVKINGRTALLRQPPQEIAMARGDNVARLCSAVFRMEPATVYTDPSLKK
jgi:hypothetical protein